MLISKNQRLCGVLDKIDNVIVEGTKMTHTQVRIFIFCIFSSLSGYFMKPNSDPIDAPSMMRLTIPPCCRKTETLIQRQ